MQEIYHKVNTRQKELERQGQKLKTIKLTKIALYQWVLDTQQT